MDKPVRINVLGGPGSGKSTTAAWIFSELKQRHIPCEMAREYVKTWAYNKRPVRPWDQVYIMGKQIQEEYTLIKAGVKVIITDSPVLLSSVYGRIYFSHHRDMIRGIDSIARSFTQECHNINILLKRTTPYQALGRYESPEVAKKVDGMIKRTLRLLVGSDFEEYSVGRRSLMLCDIMVGLRRRGINTPAVC